jgi:hypothetical protein
MKKIILGILIIFHFISCTKSESTEPEIVTVQDLLPKSNDISGWQIGTDSWYATNNEELNTAINGEAPIYTNNGFVEAAKQSYEGTVLGNNTLINIRIFDQGSITNSEAVFDEITLQLSNPIDWSIGTGTEAKIERLLSQKILFWKSKYYIYCQIGLGSDEALDVLKTFANNIDSKIN